MARFLAPKASEYIREGLEAKRLSGQELSPAQLEAIDLDNIWGKWEDEGDDEIPSRKLQVEEDEEVRWEKRDIPAIQQDPPKLKAGPECSRAMAGRSVPSILLQAPLQQGYVTVITKSAMWEHHGVQDVHSFQVLTWSSGKMYQRHRKSGKRKVFYTHWENVSSGARKNKEGR